MSAAFQSPLARDLEAFVIAKKALGRKYDWAEQRLRSFDRLVAREAAEHGGEVSLQVSDRRSALMIARWRGSGRA